MARPKTYAVCKHCGASGLAWVRMPNTRAGQPNAYGSPWAWILCESAKRDDGSVQEQADGRAEPVMPARIHHCAGYVPVAAWMTGQSETKPAGGFESKGRRRRASRPEVSQAVVATPEDEDDDPNDSEPAMQANGEPMQDTKQPPAKAEHLIAQALALVSQQAAKAVDEDRVREIVAELIEKQAPREVLNVIESRRPDGTPVATIKTAHPHLERLFRYVRARRHCYVWGPAGSSKTTSAVQAATLAELRHAVIPLSQTTTASQLFGFIDAQSNYRPTILRDFYANGGVIIFDEFDNAAGNVAALLNGLLENGSGSFPDGMVQRSPDFVVIATGNTNLRGATRDHSSRTSLDLATVARFCFIDWPYDEQMETKIVKAASPTNHKAVIVWCRAVRHTLEAERVAMTVAGPREALNIARDIEQGETFEAAAESWVWRGLDPATRDRILAKCPYPAVKDSEAAA